MCPMFTNNHLHSENSLKTHHHLLSQNRENNMMSGTELNFVCVRTCVCVCFIMCVSVWSPHVLEEQ